MSVINLIMAYGQLIYRNVISIEMWMQSYFDYRLVLVPKPNVKRWFSSMPDGPNFLGMVIWYLCRELLGMGESGGVFGWYRCVFCCESLGVSPSFMNFSVDHWNFQD